MGILTAAAFIVRPTKHRLEAFTMTQLVFGRDMIILINHIVYWRLIFQNKRDKIINDNVYGNTSRIDYDYQVGYKVMRKNKADYKYETPFKGPYKIVQCWTNDTVTLQMGATTNGLNTHMINPCK